jgi:primosomal protein N' (replication factor Y)
VKLIICSDIIIKKLFKGGSPVGEVQKYAQVLVNKNFGGLLKTYQYKLNSNIINEIKIGSRVIVPFNKTIVDGFVLKFNEDAAVDNIKDIISVIDSDLTLNEEIISVANWMKEQYLCSLAICLRCFLPLGSVSKVKKYVKINESLTDIKLEKEEKIILE